MSIGGTNKTRHAGDDLIKRLRMIHEWKVGKEAADRIEALTAENAQLRDAVYIDDLTVTLQGEDRVAAIEGLGRALDLLRADMIDEAKASLRATLAKMKGEKG